MARAQGARSQLAGVFETVYGTAPEDGYTRLPFASMTLGSAQPLLSSELLGYGRDPLPPIKDAVTTDGDIVVPIDAVALGFWLKGVFGEPDTTAIAATGTIAFDINPSPADTITLNGVTWTFVAADPDATETEIQGTLSATIDELVSNLNASENTEIEKVTYSRPDGTDMLLLTFDTAGTAGNTFTIAASSATASGETLAGGGYQHVFASGAWILPSLSLEKGLPEIPRFEMFTGCVVNSLSWQMQRSGLLTATVNLVAQGETPSATTQAGAPADITLLRFGHFQGSIERDGVSLGNVVSTEITYSNNLDRIETIRNDGMIDGADPSMATLSGRTEMRFADDTLLTQAINGEACELKFPYTLPSGESFELVAHAVYLPRPRVEISGPQGVQVTLEWQAAYDAGEEKMCTITLINKVAEY
jgi:hypothetical protein